MMKSTKNVVLVATFVVAGVALAASTVARAGPVFLTGHDPDFHAQPARGAGGTLLLTGLNFATGGTAAAAGSKFLWVEANVGDPLIGASVPGGHLIGEDGLGDIGLIAGTHFDAVNGTQFAALSNAALSSYTAIAIASSFGGMLTRIELDALIARSTDIAAFINAGGGLFAASECLPCGANLLAGATPPSLFGYLPVNVTSIGAASPFTVTSFGAGLGLTNADVNDPTHNSFGLTGGLKVVDTDKAGNATTLAGNVRVGGGGFQAVPEPNTLAMMILGFIGLGVMRERRRTG